VARRVLELGGTDAARAQAGALADAALESAATPAGRTTSLLSPQVASRAVSAA